MTLEQKPVFRYKPIHGLFGCGLVALGMAFSCSLPVVAIVNTVKPETAISTSIIALVATALIGIAGGVAGWIGNKRAQNL